MSGTNDESIGVDKGDDGKWYWTLGGEPLQIDGKTVYVNSGDDRSEERRVGKEC